MGLALDELKDDDTVETINGILVATEKSILSETENLSLDVQDGRLVMLGNESCC